MTSADIFTATNMFLIACGFLAVTFAILYLADAISRKSDKK